MRFPILSNCSYRPSRISDAFPGSHRWLEGTRLAGGAEAGNLIDDDTRHTYGVTFTAAFDFHIMIEDRSGSGGIAGDAWFDNNKLTDDTAAVPAPPTIALVTLSLLAVGSRAQFNGDV